MHNRATARTILPGYSAGRRSDRTFKTPFLTLLPSSRRPKTPARRRIADSRARARTRERTGNIRRSGAPRIRRVGHARVQRRSRRWVRSGRAYRVYTSGALLPPSHHLRRPCSFPNRRAIRTNRRWWYGQVPGARALRGGITSGRAGRRAAWRALNTR